MSFIDVRTVPEDKRWAVARRLHGMHDVELPQLSFWNYEPCAEHSGNGGPSPSCPACGVIPRRHQRVGSSWLYWAMRGLLADTVGSGKTCQVAALLAMCLESGEIPDRRAVIVARAAAVPQWESELARMVPGLRVLAVTGSMTTAQRIAAYVRPWDALVISFQTLVNKAGGSDFERIRNFDIGTVVFDDVDAMRHHGTRTAYAIKKLAETADRVIGVHGTPLQKRLPELHSFLEPLGGLQVLGTENQFKRRFVDTDRSTFWTRKPCKEHKDCPKCRYALCGTHRQCPACRSGRQVQRTLVKDGGIKPDMLPEFRRIVSPLVLRRTAKDIDDVELPAVVMNQVPIDLLPAQRQRYEQLRKGVLRRLRGGEEEVTVPEAMAAWLRGWQICSSLANLDDDGSDASAKLDWIVDKLGGDLSDEKVVCFVYFRPAVRALSQRLEQAGIEHVLMWSEEQNSRVRAARLARFRDDPECRVLIGTSSIEQSLNLQTARHLILADTIPNPARMEQIVGRIRRQGSRWSTVYVHWLLAAGTQEEALPVLIGREQGLSDAIWDEKSEIFESISPAVLMRAIAGKR